MKNLSRRGKMKCPKCKCKDSYVIDTRDTGAYIRRRRVCNKCGTRYSTFELSNAEYLELKAVKKMVDRIKG